MKGQGAAHLLFVAGLAVASLSAAQEQTTRGGDTRFQGASVTPAKSDPSVGGRVQLRGRELTATNATLRELIAFAYRRHAFDERDVIGGPEWVDSDRFDVAAQFAAEHVIDSNGFPGEPLAMMRTFLATSFKLKVHEENRDKSVYVLKMATAHGTLGPKLRRTDADCRDSARQPGQHPPCSFKTPPGRLFASTFTMPTLASLLSRHVDRPVIDHTGLKGRFDVELEAAEIQPPPGYQPGPSDLALPPAAGPTIFVAVQEQLGLVLDPQTAPVPVVVIDSAERPLTPP